MAANEGKTSKISWTPEADTRLFLTILSTQTIAIDYAKVAAAFGGSLPSSVASYRLAHGSAGASTIAIRSRMERLRGQARALGSLEVKTGGGAATKPGAGKADIAGASASPAKKRNRPAKKAAAAPTLTPEPASESQAANEDLPDRPGTPAIADSMLSGQWWHRDEDEPPQPPLGHTSPTETPQLGCRAERTPPVTTRTPVQKAQPAATAGLGGPEPASAAAKTASQKPASTTISTAKSTTAALKATTSASAARRISRRISPMPVQRSIGPAAAGARVRKGLAGPIAAAAGSKKAASKPPSKEGKKTPVNRPLTADTDTPTQGAARTNLAAAERPVLEGRVEKKRRLPPAPPRRQVRASEKSTFQQDHYDEMDAGVAELLGADGGGGGGHSSLPWEQSRSPRLLARANLLGEAEEMVEEGQSVASDGEFRPEDELMAE
ncbi:MAG: hypothetical protein M1826_006292 [Phylliscum demangeonii]|nr:MAG: hypothetical protein M1826_006292 [Phylliscum demangeonii]